MEGYEPLVQQMDDGDLPAQDAPPQEGSFSIVLLPAAPSIAPGEMILPLPATTAVSETELDDLLGPCFRLRDGESVDMDMLEKQAEADYRCTDYVCPHVSPEVLKRAAEAGTLQKVTLSIAVDSMDGTNDGSRCDNENSVVCRMYYDESAGFKGREKNHRAHAYLRQDTTHPNNDNDTAAEGDTICGDVLLVRLLETNNHQPASMRPVDIRGILSSCE